MKKNSIAIFTIFFLIGIVTAVSMKPSHSTQNFRHLTKEVTFLPIFEIANRIIATSEFNDQRFSLMMIPEVKNSLIFENQSFSTYLNQDKFWENFITKHSEELHAIDLKTLEYLSKSLYVLKRDELLDYLNLKESPDIKIVQNKINEFMKIKFQEEYQKSVTNIQQIAKHFYAKEKAKISKLEESKNQQMQSHLETLDVNEEE